MHNTIALDDRPQSIPSSPFHWHKTATATLGVWGSRSEFDIVEAQHDGYVPEIHRRAVLRAPDDLWLVADHILGAGQHRFDVYWHIDPAWSVERTSIHDATLAHPESLSAVIASTAGQLDHVRGDLAGLGWCAPVYGKTQPSPTLRFSGAADAPFSLITVMSVGVPGIELTCEPATVSTDESDRWHRVAAVGVHDSSRFIALFATVAAPRMDASTGSKRAPQRIAAFGGELTTDARVGLLQICHDGAPLRLLLVDATHVTWTGTGGFAFGPLDSAEDLHLDQPALARLSRTQGTPVATRKNQVSICVE